MEAKLNIVTKAKDNGIDFFDIFSTIDEIKDDKEREIIKQEYASNLNLAPCPPFAIINPSQV